MRWLVAIGFLLVVACLAIFVLPGRVCICVRNASKASLSATVTVPGARLRFTDIEANSERCEAARVVGDGSLSLEVDGAALPLEYVHADMGGDLRVRYSDGAASLDESREDEHGIFAWRSCW